MKSRKVAITGGIATGKSTVISFLRDEGYKVASADEVSRVTLEDPLIRSEIASLGHFQENWTSDDLRTLLLQSSDIRKKINDFLHPIIWSRLQGLDADFVEIPLLFELALQHAFVEVWCTTCSEKVQTERLIQRYGSELDLRRILSTQLNVEAKSLMSDWVIRTDQPMETVRAIVLFRAALIATSEG